jgi:MFS family permease
VRRWRRRSLIERFGHVRTYAAGSGVILLAVLGHAVSAAFPLWLVLRTMVGVATICQWMVLESWLNERADARRRGAVLAIYMFATYGGMMLGQLAVGIDDGEGTLALSAVAAAFVLCLVPLALTRLAPPAAGSSQPVAIGRLVRGLSQPLLTVLVSGMLNGSFFGLAAIYAARQGMDAAAVGGYLALTVVAGLCSQLPLGALSDRMPRARLIRGIALLLTVVSLPLGFYDGLPQAALPVFAVAIGSLQFCLYPLGAGLANERIDPAMRVSLAGLLLTVFGIGSCIGPLVAGALMTWAGASSLYCFVAACAAMLAAGMWERKRAGQSGPLAST